MFIADFAPETTNAVGVHWIVRFFYDAFVFGELAPLLTEAQWAHKTTTEYLPIAQADVLLLARAISIECEDRNVSSAPIAQIVRRWRAHWRTFPAARQAFQNFTKKFNIEQLIDDTAESVQRLLRITEPEVRALVRGEGRKLPVDPKSSSGVEKVAATEGAESPPPPIRRRARAPAPAGWIYLIDAMQRYKLRRTTAFLYAGELSKANAADSVLDADSKQRRVREEVLRALLIRKGQLKA
jgi:hypothetical protein